MIIISLSSCGSVKEFASKNHTKKALDTDKKTPDMMLFRSLTTVFGNLEGAKEAVKNGADVNEFNFGVKGLKSPLVATIEEDNYMLFEYLLSAGADPNAISGNGKTTPLFSLLEKNSDLKFAKLLVQYGVDLNKVCSKDFTPIEIAIMNGETEYINFLLDNHVELNEKITDILAGKYNNWNGTSNIDKYEVTPRLIHALQDKGLKIKLEPIVTAAILGETEKVNSYINAGKLTEKNVDTIILYTAAFGVPDTFNLIENKGYKVLETEVKGINLFKAAAFYGNMKTVPYFIEKGVPIYRNTFSEGDTPLVEAVRNNQSEIVNYLIKQNITLVFDERVDKDGMPIVYPGNDILAIATQNGDLEMMKLFIDNGYILSQQALANALYFSNNKETAEYLLTIGANPTKECFGFLATPLDQAIKNNNLEVIKEFVEHGVNIETAFLSDVLSYRSSEENALNVTKYLLENGVAVNSSTETGQTPVEEAIDMGTYRQLSILIDYNTKRDGFREGSSYNLLMLASNRPSKNILAYLLKQRKIDINLKEEKTGNTALHYAIENGYTENVKELLKYNPDLTLKNKKGQTPLELAKNKKYKVIQKLLKEEAKQQKKK